MMWIWFAGGRRLGAEWGPVVATHVAKVKAARGRVVVGCALGLDRMVAQECYRQGVDFVIVAARPRKRWVRAAEAAGVSVRWLSCGVKGRTEHIAARLPAGSVLVAFPGGAGTALSVRLASARGLRVVRPKRVPDAGVEWAPDLKGFVYVPRREVPRRLWSCDSAWPLLASRGYKKEAA